MQYKVSLLQLLMEAAYSTNLVRVEAFQNAEDTHRLLMTRQEKLWVGVLSFIEVCHPTAIPLTIEMSHLFFYNFLEGTKQKT